jgi:hypothetical protein
MVKVSFFSTEQSVWCEMNEGILHFGTDIISQGSFSLTVADDMGRVVWNTNAVQGSSIALPANIPNGMYIIYLTNDREKYASKILITR